MVVFSPASQSASVAETAFKRLAEVFGKQTLPWETVKGRAALPLPPGEPPVTLTNVGAWTLDYDHSTGTYIIKEIADKTGRHTTPFGVFRLPADHFIVAVDMIIRAINLHKSLYPTPPGVRHEIPPGEIYGAKLPQVTIGGTTYYRDDVRKEFREVGKPENRVSFHDYELKYFAGHRILRANFSGNVVTFQSILGDSYETTNQENAIQAFAYWIHNGVLKPGAGTEVPKKPGRGKGNWLEVESVQRIFHITDSTNQRMRTEDASKAVKAVRSWIYGGVPQ